MLAVAIRQRLLYAGGHPGSRCTLAEVRGRWFIKVDLVDSPISPYTVSNLCAGSRNTLPVCRSLYPDTHFDCTLYAGCVGVC